MEGFIMGKCLCRVLRDSTKRTSLCSSFSQSEEIIDGYYLFEKLPDSTTESYSQKNILEYVREYAYLVVNYECSPFKENVRLLSLSHLMKETYVSEKEPSSFAYALVDSFHTYSPSLPFNVKGDF